MTSIYDFSFELSMSKHLKRIDSFLFLFNSKALLIPFLLTSSEFAVIPF